MIDKASASNGSAGKRRSLKEPDGEEFFGGREEGSPVFGGSPVLPEGHVQDVYGIVAREVGGGARPRILVDELGEAGAYGISFHIAKRDRQMIPVERAGIEAILPEVAGATAARVQIVCIAAVGAPEGHGKGVRLIRHGHQMDVIRHEAVGQNTEA